MEANNEEKKVSGELTRWAPAALSRLGPGQSQKHIKAMRVTRMGRMMAKASQTGLMPLSLDESSLWRSEVDIGMSLYRYRSRLGWFYG